MLCRARSIALASPRPPPRPLSPAPLVLVSPAPLLLLSPARPLLLRLPPPLPLFPAPPLPPEPTWVVPLPLLPRQTRNLWFC
jgi:hypothetical protein